MHKRKHNKNRLNHSVNKNAVLDPKTVVPAPIEVPFHLVVEKKINYLNY